MTFTGKPGDPTVVSWGDSRLDMFARDVDDTLLHFWSEGWDEGSKSLGGILSGDPVAVALGPRRLHVFARGSGGVGLDAGGHLLHWWWSEAQGRMTGPETKPGWRLVHNPIAVVAGLDTIDVYARGAGDQLRRWRMKADILGEPEYLGMVVKGGLAAIYEVGVPDVFACGSDDRLVHYGQLNGAGGPEVWEEADGGYDGGAVIGTPAAVWTPSPHRFDVVGRTGDGSTLAHWGWSGSVKSHAEPDVGIDHPGHWFGPGDRDSYAPLDGHCRGDPVMVAPGPKRLEVFARDRDGALLQWSWDGAHWSPSLSWRGPTRVGPNERVWRFGSNPAVLLREGRIELFAWDVDREADANGNARRLLRLVQRTSMSDTGAPEWLREQEWIVDPSKHAFPAGVDSVHTVVDHVLVRPADLVVLGLSWSGYELRPGDPTALHRTGPGAQVVVTFPPQHIGEEVSPAGEVPETGGPSHSRLAGPSQVVFTPTAERIELTAVGVLAALQRAPIVPHTDTPAPGAAQTEIELPWQLITTPVGGLATSDHDGVPMPLMNSGSVGLWRARIRAVAGGPAALTAGLELQTLKSGAADPFATALGQADRQLIRAQGAPARLDRLELSALGGSLSAHGSWPGVRWDHEATLGRDQQVGVEIHGVLYPSGHRAQYSEITERMGAEPGTGATAELRKRTVLTVTEPTRDEPDDPALARAFPFARTEIATLEFAGVDDPNDPDLHPAGTRGAWTKYPRTPLLSEAHAKQKELEDRRDAWPPLIDELGGASEYEALADSGDATVAKNAGDFLELVEQINLVKDQIEAAEDNPSPVPWFFWPMRDGQPVEFSVRCEGAAGSVEFSMPMLFVADQDLEQTEAMPAFDTLHDDGTEYGVAHRLAKAFAAEKAGVVTLTGDPVDLIRSAAGEGAPGDVHLVNRLSIFGVMDGDGRGFRPRLGPPPPPPPRPGEPPTPPIPLPDAEAGGWAFDVTLPALRTLLPDRADGHRALMGFHGDYETCGLAPDVTSEFAIVGKGLDIDFTANADRSGGLISPVIKADVLSRTTGLASREALATTNPLNMLDPAATVLGFSLADLLADLEATTDAVPSVADPPTMVTDLAGGQPTVRMTWDKVRLTTPFLGKKGSTEPPTLKVSVVSGPEETITECTLSDFALAFPKETPLLTLSFGILKFTQRAGHAPTLTVTGVEAEFGGDLELLQILQKKVGLGAAGPTIDVSTDRIVARYALPVPDVAAGAFVMQNLAFSAAVTVPFRGEPVSVALGFATRAKPFNLSVLMFGGGGYVDLEFDHTGLSRMEISLQFGASVAVKFLVASGEAHVLGGIRYELVPPKAPETESSVVLTGFIRIGGSLDVLGLVSVSVELVLTLGYETTGNQLVGRATLVIEIDLTLFADSVELDSGPWVIAGDDAPAGATPASGAPGVLVADDLDPYLSEWLEYRRAFAAVA